MKKTDSTRPNETQIEEMLRQLDDGEHVDEVSLDAYFAWQSDDHLEQNEQDVLFAQITSKLAKPREPRRRRPTSGWIQWSALCAAAMAVVVAAVFLLRDSPAVKTTQRYKGSATPDVQLYLYKGRLVDHSPQVIGPIKHGETIEPTSHIVFRYKLSEPCWLVLVGQQDGQNVEVLWSSPKPEPAGEHEIQSNAQALSLPPGAYVGNVTLSLIAVRSKPSGRFEALTDLSKSFIQQQCHDCGVATFSIQVPR